MTALLAWALTHFKTVLFLAVSVVVVTLIMAITYLAKDNELARNALKTEQERVANYRAANVAQQQTIDTLSTKNERDSQLSKRIAERLDVLSRQQDDARNALEELARTNAQIRSYLDTTVPDDIRRLLGDPTARRK
jgi:LysB family phage lysis regulatory protein